MSIDTVQQALKRHRPAAIAGALLGLVLLLGWVGYEVLATPATPDMQKAQPAEMVAFVRSPRGLARLPQIEQERFLERWREHLTQEPAKKALADYLRGMNEDDRREFSEAIFRQFKRAFLDDARRFAQLKADEKSAFIRRKLADYRDQMVPLKEIAASFKGLVGSRTDDMQQWIIEHSTAEERALGEPYVDALKRVREQVKKEDRVSKAP